MVMKKTAKRLGKPPNRYTPKQRAAILAEAKAKGLTGDQVAAKHGIAKVTYYLWRKQAGAHGWYGVGRRVAWTPTPRKSRGELPSALKRQVREIVAQVVRDEVATQFSGLARVLRRSPQSTTKIRPSRRG